MKIKRQYVAPLLLLVLVPIWFITNKQADQSINLDFAKSKIAAWNQEPWLKSTFKDVTLKANPDSRVGTILVVSGKIQSDTDFKALRDWLESSSPSFQDERNYEGQPVPGNAKLVRFDIVVAEGVKAVAVEK